jgi:hypothetical protein
MDEVPGESPAPRDLDLELDGFGLDDLDIPDEVPPPPVESTPHAAAKPAPEAPASPEAGAAATPEPRASATPKPRAPAISEVWELKDVANPPAALLLQLVIEGLQGELHRALQGLIGKTVELPAMKIRIKGDDLG